MPKLKVMSGKEVIAVFTKLGFEIRSQKGSHVKLRRYRKKTKGNTYNS